MFSSHKPVEISITSSDPEDQPKRPRKGLKTLQQTAIDKENLTGRPTRNLKEHLHSKYKLEELEKQCKKSNKKTQANLDKLITEDDLTNEAGPSENYWKILSEKTKLALQEALEENEKLHNLVGELTEKNDMYKIMLDEANSFVESFKEMLEDNNDTGIDVKDVSTSDETSFSETDNTKDCTQDVTAEETSETSVEVDKSKV